MGQDILLISSDLCQRNKNITAKKEEKKQTKSKPLLRFVYSEFFFLFKRLTSQLHNNGNFPPHFNFLLLTVLQRLLALFALLAFLAVATATSTFHQRFVGELRSDHTLRDTVNCKKAECLKTGAACDLGLNVTTFPVYVSKNLFLNPSPNPKTNQ